VQMPGGKAAVPMLSFQWLRGPPVDRSLQIDVVVEGDVAGHDAAVRVGGEVETVGGVVWGAVVQHLVCPDAGG